MDGQISVAVAPGTGIGITLYCRQQEKSVRATGTGLAAAAFTDLHLQTPAYDYNFATSFDKLFFALDTTYTPFANSPDVRLVLRIVNDTPCIFVIRDSECKAYVDADIDPMKVHVIGMKMRLDVMPNNPMPVTAHDLAKIMGYPNFTKPANKEAAIERICACSAKITSNYLDIIVEATMNCPEFLNNLPVH